MLSFWTGLFLFIGLGILIIVIAAFISSKLGKGGSLGGLLGFFLAFGFVLLMFLTAGRLYVVTGDTQFDDYLVYGKQEYTLKRGKKIPVQIEGKKCMVINDWEKPVVMEFMVYGGYGFGGDTKWVDPQEAELFEENKIFYFFENDRPPKEIMIKGGDASEKTIRLWLRNRRE